MNFFYYSINDGFIQRKLGYAQREGSLTFFVSCVSVALFSTKCQLFSVIRYLDTPTNEVWRVYRSHPVGPSVCTSVRASRNLVRGITSKVFKLVTSNFRHR